MSQMRPNPSFHRTLMADLISLRRGQPTTPKRPVEQFVERCGELALYNHPPSHAERLEMNRKSGYFG